jgi:hypothetical protein
MMTVGSIIAALSTSFLSGERCRASAGDDSFQTSSHRLSTRLPEYYCAPILISRNTRWRSSSPISTHSSARNQDVRYFSRKHAENQVLAARHLLALFITTAFMLTIARIANKGSARGRSTSYGIPVVSLLHLPGGIMNSSTRTESHYTRRSREQSFWRTKF